MAFKRVKQLKAKINKKIGRHEVVHLDKGEVAQGLWLRSWLWVHGHTVLKGIAYVCYFILMEFEDCFGFRLSNLLAL